MSGIQKQKWKQVEFSRNKIIKSGKIIKNPKSSDEQISEAVVILNNWRAAHAFPLHIIYVHLRRMAKTNDEFIVAERLKRLDSIIKKLSREPTMSLWEMQDLGGCRFIVPTVQDVYRYAEKYKHSRKRHIFKGKYDYITKPKNSGYRSLHMVYKYHSDNKAAYNGMLIEIQYRTHLQHLWATAVETIGLFTKQAIKSGQGSDDIKRFFVLISSLFAIRECQPVVPGTIEDVNELISEIEEIDSRCTILDMLSAISAAVNYQEQRKFANEGYYILILNYYTRNLSIKHFKPSQIEEANAVYGKIERTRAESKVDAVLVRVSSFKTLKLAYPNYFTDINEFLKLVKDYLK